MMSTNKIIVLSLFLSFSFSNIARGEIEASDYTQTRIAQVHSLNYEDKTAVISGYRYGFTGLKGYDKPTVRMLGSSSGAYELLRVGMKVRVEYRLSKDARIVIDLEQVPDETLMGVPVD